MGDVVSIEVDGEVGGPQLERGRAQPAWGMPAAVLLVGALVLGVGWSFLRSGGAPSAASLPAVTTPTTERAAPSTTASPLVVGGASTTVPAAPALNLQDPVAAARAALVAWGDFAGTGDLSQVRRIFAAEGPQLRQLEQEAASIERRAGGGYRVALTEAAAEVDGSNATVTGTVSWSRANEADQVYRWAIELRLFDGTWHLFTVRMVEA